MNAIVKLGDVATVVTKGTTPTTVGYQFVESGIPFLRAEDVNGGFVSFADADKKITPECHKAFARSQLQAGDLLITIAGTVGRVGIVPDGAGTANCNQAVSIIRLKPDFFDLQFLGYFLRTSAVQHRFRQQGTTATITNISLAQIKDVEVPLLPLPEQHRIVDLLSRAEGIVRLRREAEKKAAELIPALFLDMFGDPATNLKKWPVRKVSDFVARFEGGKNIQAGSENGSPYRILKVSAATSGIYRESESKPSPDGYNPPISHIVRSGDMLFSRANTEELVGATAIIFATNGKTLLPDKLWRFVWSEPVAPAYMHALFQSRHVRRELGKLSSGTSASMRNISQAKLFSLLLPVAPYVEQERFAEYSASVQSIIKQQSAATTKAQATFDALLAQVFTGNNANDHQH
jgi:type I restriction enzyme S subunit